MKRLTITIVLLIVLFLILGHGSKYGAAAGAINPNVTQANIKKTICVSGWTSTVRPPVSYTNKLKLAQIHGADPKLYEEDHFIAIEIGGSPTDPKNLWAERYPEAHFKDVVENYLHKQICSGKLTLKEAQSQIRNWQPLYQMLSTRAGGTTNDYDEDDE